MYRKGRCSAYQIFTKEQLTTKCVDKVKSLLYDVRESRYVTSVKMFDMNGSLLNGIKNLFGRPKDKSRMNVPMKEKSD